MVALYNEIDPFAAAWLRELIRENLIAPGDVAECSIEDLKPNDIRGYTQFHAFAGVGVWSYALRRAGWPDDRPVWTMSCPCQPFSAAGKGAGFDDERHLWPAAYHLIGECGPPVVAGEQVASKDGLGWLDLVQADMEGTGYAFGAVDTCAAGFGAPHIRQRLYWIGEGVDNADNQGLEGHRLRSEKRKDDSVRAEVGSSRAPSASRGLADADGRDASPKRQQRGGEQRQQPENSCPLCLGTGWLCCSPSCGPCDCRVADAKGDGREHQPNIGSAGIQRSVLREGAAEQRLSDLGAAFSGAPTSGPTNGLWGSADWLYCRDGKWRPVEPGTFPLAHGAAARVGRLRGYGNAINAEQATAFIEAYLETEADQRVRLTGAFA